MSRPSLISQDQLISLSYELLDAHEDTRRLAHGLECDERWSAHLDYLRALHRVGRVTLARATQRSSENQEVSR
jgi:hypothetical protein